jgi:hypothetical protein
MANRLISEILKNRDRFIYPIKKIDLSLFYYYVIIKIFSVPFLPSLPSWWELSS